MKNIFLFIILLGILAFNVIARNSTQDTRYEILINSKSIVPKIDNIGGYDSQVETAILEIESAHQNSSHMILQFSEDLTPSGVTEIESKGINLLRSLNNNKNWIVSIDKSKAVALNTFPSIRWVASVTPEYKIKDHIVDNEVAKYVVNSDGSLNLNVVCYDDVPDSVCKNTISSYAALFRKTSEKSFEVKNVSIASLNLLAELDVVKAIEPISGPIQNNLDTARLTIGVDNIQAQPYKLNGSGVIVAMWEAQSSQSPYGYKPYDTGDIHGRVRNGDPGSVVSWHATGVASILAGDGTIYSNFKGMSPKVRIITYDASGPTESEMFTSVFDEHNNSIANGSVLSQNSWLISVNESEYSNCYKYGDYSNNEEIYDDVVRGRYNKTMVIVFAVGNERDNTDCNLPSNPYDSIPTPATGKNMITVGAVYSDQDVSTCFSSWGPTNDGRIKPDVVAAGDEGACGIADGKSIITYINSLTLLNATGTSFAAPAVSGLISLMIQQYKMTYSQFYPSSPLPSTIRAILLQTSNDIANEGPDYQTGYGKVNASNAVDSIINRNFMERQLDATGEYDVYNITVSPGESELKVTLAWDDLGSQISSTHNLMNDLDLTLISPNNVTYYPWKLNSSFPALNASRGVDHTNNAEQIQIDNPTEGVWRINVSAYSIDASSTQKYSLVGSSLGSDKIFFIFNEGNSSLSVSSISSSASWLKINASSFTIPAGSNKVVRASINVTGLVAGIYKANITVSSNDANEPTIKIPVNLDMTRTDADGDGYYSNSTGGNDPDDNNFSVIPSDSSYVPISSISVSPMSEVYSNSTLRKFKFFIKNLGEISYDNLSWSLDTDDSFTVNSTNSVSISPGSNMSVILEYNFSSNGIYDMIYQSSASNISSSGVYSVTIGELGINYFDDVSIQGKNVSVKIKAQNFLSSNITGLNWTIKNDNGQFINGTQKFNLTGNQTIFIFVKTNYSLSGTFIPNATITNGTFFDAETTTITI